MLDTDEVWWVLNCKRDQWGCDAYQAGENYHMWLNRHDPEVLDTREVISWKSTEYNPKFDAKPPKDKTRCITIPGPVRRPIIGGGDGGN